LSTTFYFFLFLALSSARSHLNREIYSTTSFVNCKALPCYTFILLTVTLLSPIPIIRACFLGIYWLEYSVYSLSSTRMHLIHSLKC